MKKVCDVSDKHVSRFDKKKTKYVLPAIFLQELSAEDLGKSYFYNLFTTNSDNEHKSVILILIYALDEREQMSTRKRFFYIVIVCVYGMPVEITLLILHMWKNLFSLSFSLY